MSLWTQCFGKNKTKHCGGSPSGWRRKASKERLIFFEEKSNYTVPKELRERNFLCFSPSGRFFFASSTQGYLWTLHYVTLFFYLKAKEKANRQNGDNNNEKSKKIITHQKLYLS